MDQAQFEGAILLLDELMEADDKTEPDYQEWFEAHPVVFDSYGYKRVIPHPELTENGTVLYIPDFLAQRIDGLWEIFEIKRPDTRVLRDVTSRQTFYASLQQYYEQCRDYSQFFDDAAHRAEFAVKYGVDIQKSPHSILVAGRSAGLDKAAAYRLLADRGTKVTLQTYDDVRERLDFYRVTRYGKYEHMEGLCRFMALVINQVPGGKENYILDIGTTEHANRMSIYVDRNDDLCFRVIDARGESYQVRNRQGTDGFKYGEVSYLIAELGVAEEHSIQSIESVGKGSTRHLLSQLDFALPSNGQFLVVLGSDVTGKAETNMHLAEHGLYSSTLKFDERINLQKYLFDKYSGGFEKYVEFTDHQFMYVTGHPNFPDGSGDGGDHRPIFRDKSASGR